MKVHKKEVPERPEHIPMSGYTVWINNVACHCQTLATAERMVRRLRRQGRDLFICSALGEGMDEFPVEAHRITLKRRTGRLLRFPLISAAPRKEQPTDHRSA